MLRLATVIPLLLPSFAWAAMNAPAKPAEKPFTVLQIMYYDGGEKIEIVRVSAGLWRIHQIMQEQRVWDEAYKLARYQWHQWFFQNTQENKARQWVLPKPAPPRFATFGRYAADLDAEEKVRELIAVRDKRMAQFNAIKDLHALVYLDNFTENRKLVRSLLGKAREALIERSDDSTKSWGRSKKREVWDLVHLAEWRARQQVFEKTPEGQEPDILDVYMTQQELLKAIYQQYKMTEDQWYVIWEEGDKQKWPLPPNEYRAATKENVLKALQDLRTKPNHEDGLLALRILKNMGKAALPHLIRIAEDGKANLRAEAFKAMTLATGQNLGLELSKWKVLQQELEAAQARAAAEAGQPDPMSEAERRAKADAQALLARNVVEEGRNKEQTALTAGAVPGLEATPNKPKGATPPTAIPVGGQIEDE